MSTDGTVFYRTVSKMNVLKRGHTEDTTFCFHTEDFPKEGQNVKRTEDGRYNRL